MKLFEGPRYATDALVEGDGAGYVILDCLDEGLNVGCWCSGVDLLQDHDGICWAVAFYLVPGGFGVKGEEGDLDQGWEGAEGEHLAPALGDKAED
jgi:hypothetical protein